MADRRPPLDEQELAVVWFGTDSDVEASLSGNGLRCVFRMLDGRWETRSRAGNVLRGIGVDFPH